MKDMYLRKRYKHGDVIEDVCYLNGRYGRKDTSFVRLGGVTPEAQLKWQEKNDIRKVWRLLDANFSQEDMWVTLTFKREYRPSDNDEAKKIIQLFLRKVRKLYKKNNLELKYVMGCGRGKNGGIHFHLVMNHLQMQAQVLEIWNTCANKGEYSYARFAPLSKNKNYLKIAVYIIKNGREDFGQIDRVFGKRFSYSANLVCEKVKPQKMRAKAWAKKTVVPEGYVIDTENSHEGINEYGYRYRYTVFVRRGGI